MGARTPMTMRVQTTAGLVGNWVTVWTDLTTNASGEPVFAVLAPGFGAGRDVALFFAQMKSQLKKERPWQGERP